MRFAAIRATEVALLFAVCLLFPTAAAQASLDVKELTVNNYAANPSHNGTTPMNQAGAHPDIVVMSRFCSGSSATPSTALQCTTAELQDQVDSYTIKLPPGVYGDPTLTPPCAYPLFLVGACPTSSQVGIVDSWAEGTAQLGQQNPSGQAGLPYRNPLWNVQIPGYAPALLGTTVTPGVPGFPRPAYVQLRTDDDFGIDSPTPNLPDGAGSIQVKIEQIAVRLFGQNNQSQPFMTQATNCRSDVSNSLWRTAITSKQTAPPAETSLRVTPTGCGSVPFDPSIEMTPETARAATPSGQQISLQVPDTEPIKNSHLEDITVNLPQGVVLNAAAAKRLAGCSEQQIGLTQKSPVAKFNNDPTQCPEDSKIGTVSVVSPPVDGDNDTSGEQPLSGSVYFGQPTAPGGATASNPWPLYIEIEGAGLRVKLRGEVTVDQSSGRVTSVFTNNPQTPFTRFDLNLRGGDLAVLQNPSSCGNFQLTSSWTPWSGTADAQRSDDLVTSDNCGPRGFAPKLDAAVTNKQAGGFTQSKLVIDRAAGDQLIKSLQLSLPSGLVGSLAAVPTCSLAALDAAACPSDTRIGRVEAALGEGTETLRVNGAAFLADPSVPGDAATVGVVIPGKVGPIDLGNVVVRNRVTLRQSDGGLDVQSGALPLQLHGIPLPVRQIVIDINRDGFFRQPTGCENRSLTATFTSENNVSAGSTFTDRAVGCENLPFAPKLRMIAKAQNETKRFQHTGLKAIVTQNPGEENISSTRVRLPQVLRPETVQFNRPGALCKDPELATNTCPALSQAGTAKATTPLLPQPLEGPVYLVQRTGQVIPDLAVMLRGRVALQLSASNRIEGVRTVNTFTGIPDVPVTSFELNINGGRFGILKNFADLCTIKDTADAEFVGQNGKVYKSKPELEVEGCAVTASGRISLASKRAKVKKGKAAVRLRCASGAPCKGSVTLAGARKKSFSIGAGKRKTLKVSLRSKAKTSVRRRGKLRVKATLRVTGGKTTKTKLTLVR